MDTIWKNAKPLLCLFLIMLIAYLPISTFIFGMKNDAFSDNFPQKFFLSQCIQTGNSPLWNPYMNFGYPAYADMGFAFYNPVVWLFATIGYSAYLLTAEVLFYIYIGGVTMYYLGRRFSFSKSIAVVAAAMYMCSGFFVGAIQHINSLAAAAFLPLLLMFVITLFDEPNYRNSFLLSVAAYMVFASGHPAMPIASLYYTLAFSVCYITIHYRLVQKRLLRVLLYFGVSLGLLFIYTLPALYSYANIIAEYERYVRDVPYEAKASATVSNLLSLLFPVSTISHSYFLNDVSFRNLYFSLAGFLLIFFAFTKKSKWLFPLLGSGVLLFLLSLGGSVRETFYNHLPFIKNVRTNGHFTVFTILSACCLAGFGLQNLASQQLHFYSLLKRIGTAMIILLVIAALVLCLTQTYQLSAFYHKLLLPGSFTQKIKIFYDDIDFPNALLISLALSIAILLVMILQKHFSIKWLTILIVTDLVINAIIYLPVTGVGMVRVKQIQEIYNSSPAGIPVPSFIPVNDIDTLPAQTTGLTGSITYYNKQIGTTRLTDYPSYFTGTLQYFASSDTTIINHKPYLFFKSESAGGKKADGKIDVTVFDASHIVIHTSLVRPDTLVYLQNHYKYWFAVINKQPMPITTIYKTFMAVPVASGNSTIEFIYRDKILILLCFIAIAGFLSAGFYYALQNRKSYK